MADFQKTSWGWQLEQLQQRVIEWLQAKLGGILPKSSLPAWLISLIGFLFWSLLLVGLAWVSYQLINFFWQKRNQLHRPSPTLPSMVIATTVAALLADAQRWQRQQNYSEACRCLYLAMLQRLHDAQLIPHQNSRTDREYAALLKKLPILQDSTVLLRTHEQLQFADRSISAAGFDNCQEAYNQVDAKLKQQMTS